jgi:hypothetical protein
MSAQADGYSSDLPDFSDVPDPARSRRAVVSPVRLGPAPTRADLRRARWLALLVVAGWALAQLAALGLRFDWEKLPFSYVALTLLLPLALGVLGLFVAVQPGPLGLGAPRGMSLALIVLGPLSVIGTALLLPEPYAGGLAGGGRAIFMCGNLALGWAAVPILAAALALRNTFAAGAVWRSALVGTACGVGAAVAAQLRCPVTGVWHIVLAHGSVVVVAALLGALLLPRATQA